MNNTATQKYNIYLEFDLSGSNRITHTYELEFSGEFHYFISNLPASSTELVIHHETIYLRNSISTEIHLKNMKQRLHQKSY